MDKEIEKLFILVKSLDCKCKVYTLKSERFTYRDRSNCVITSGSRWHTHDDPTRTVSFEYVLDSSSGEEQEQLLFHLDYFLK